MANCCENFTNSINSNHLECYQRLFLTEETDENVLSALAREFFGEHWVQRPIQKMAKDFLIESSKKDCCLFEFFVQSIPFFQEISNAELDRIILDICITKKLWNQKNMSTLIFWVDLRMNHARSIYIDIFSTYIESKEYVIPVEEVLLMAKELDIINFERFAEPYLLDSMFKHIRSRELVQFFTEARGNLPKNLEMLLTIKAVESGDWELMNLLLNDTRNPELLVLKGTIILTVLAVFGLSILSFINSENAVLRLASLFRFVLQLGLLSINLFDMHRLKQYCTKFSNSKYLEIFSDSSHRLILMVSSMNANESVWVFRATVFLVLLNEKLQKSNDYLWYKILDNMFTILVYSLLSINILIC